MKCRFLQMISTLHASLLNSSPPVAFTAPYNTSTKGKLNFTTLFASVEIYYLFKMSKLKYTLLFSYLRSPTV